MLSLREKAIMINCINKRQSRHLSKLESEKAPPDVLRAWQKFYLKMLDKYDFV